MSLIRDPYKFAQQKKVEEPKEVPSSARARGSVTKEWVAGEDPVPPLPEDTGGVIQEDGSKVWGTLPKSEPSPVKPKKPGVAEVITPSETPVPQKEYPWTTPVGDIPTAEEIASFKATGVVYADPHVPYVGLFTRERILEEQALTTPFMLGLETEEEKARQQYEENLLLEESRARIQFIAQLEEHAPSEFETLTGGQLLTDLSRAMSPEERKELLKARARERAEQYEDPRTYEYTETQKQLFGKEITRFESDVQTWKTEQQEVFEENVGEWRRGEESRLEEHVQDWRSTWRPKGLAERLFEHPIKENPIFRIVGGAKALEQLSGVVATGESFLYGVGGLLGVPTPRAPPTVTGGVVSTIAGSVKMEPTGEMVTTRSGRQVPGQRVVVDPKLSPEMKALSEKGVPYATGTIVGEIGLALGLGALAGKVSRKVIAPRWGGSRPEKFLLKHSDWYFKKYGRLADMSMTLPDPDSVRTIGWLQQEAFAKSQLMKGYEFGRYTKGVKGGVLSYLSGGDIKSIQYTTGGVSGGLRKYGRTGLWTRAHVSPATHLRPIPEVLIRPSLGVFSKGYFTPVKPETTIPYLSLSESTGLSPEAFAESLKKFLTSQRGGVPMSTMVMAPQRVGQLVKAPISGVSRAVTRDPFGASMLLLRGGVSQRYQDPTEVPTVKPKTPQVTHIEVPTVPFLGMDYASRTDLEDDLDVAPVIHTGLTDILDKVKFTPLEDPVVGLDPLQTPYVTPDVPTITKQRTDVVPITLLKTIQTPRLTFGYPQFDITPLLWDLQELRYPVAGEGTMLDFVLGKHKKKRRK